jgi:hypothetical protein
MVNVVRLMGRNELHPPGCNPILAPGGPEIARVGRLI